MKPLTLILWSVLAGMLAACSTPQGNEDTTVTVGTFNIKWLGDGQGDHIKRSNHDYLRIADVVIKSEADVLGLQEIENEAALGKILRYLDGYDGFVSDAGGRMRVAVIYKKSVHVESLGDYAALKLDRPNRLRPGLVLQCRKGAFDWIQMVVHLKSTSRYDSTSTLRDLSRELRQRQATVLRGWVDSVVADGRETDVIITGDINDYPQRRSNGTLDVLSEGSSVVFLTKEIRSCRNKRWYSIDHVIASSQAALRYIDGSARTENTYEYLSDADVEMVSDHCPVVVRFSLLEVDTD